jgi:hypothetical protein
MPVTFISELETRTVHNPYALAMPTVQIMEPLGWDDEAHGGAHPTLVQAPYARPQGLPRKGGICYGLRPIEVANVIYEVSGVVCAGVDIFTNNKGCCSVWVRSEHEAELIRAAMHHCVWMAPPAVGFALRAKNALSSRFLEEEVHRLVQDRGEHFPRHLVTVERYVVFAH